MTDLVYLSYSAKLKYKKVQQKYCLLSYYIIIIMKADPCYTSHVYHLLSLCPSHLHYLRETLQIQPTNTHVLEDDHKTCWKIQPTITRVGKKNALK